MICKTLKCDFPECGKLTSSEPAVKSAIWRSYFAKAASSRCASLTPAFCSCSFTTFCVELESGPRKGHTTDCP